MSLSRQLSVFLFIGGVCTGGHYIILIACVRLGLLDPVWASALGFCISAAFNYLLNRRLTFGSTRTHSSAAPRFVGVALSGLAINTALIALLNGVLGWHYLFAQVIATGATLVWNFLLHKIWTFAGSKSDRLHPGEESV